MKSIFSFTERLADGTELGRVYLAANDMDTAIRAYGRLIGHPNSKDCGN